MALAVVALAPEVAATALAAEVRGLVVEAMAQEAAAKALVVAETALAAEAMAAMGAARTGWLAEAVPTKSTYARARTFSCSWAGERRRQDELCLSMTATRRIVADVWHAAHSVPARCGDALRPTEGTSMVWWAWASASQCFAIPGTQARL